MSGVSDSRVAVKKLNKKGFVVSYLNSKLMIISYVNAHKMLVPPIVLVLMYWFHDWSTEAFVYLCDRHLLHASRYNCSDNSYGYSNKKCPRSLY
jgi:hypothetical protein